MLGQKIENLTIATIEFTFRASITDKENKLPFLENSIVSINLLKILIRLAKDIHALDSKKYIEVEQYLQELGRMLGGWKRSLKIGKQDPTRERTPQFGL